MINLLPPDVKKSYRYAQRNSGLRRWVSVGILALVGLVAIATYGLLSFQQTTNHLNQQVTANKTLFTQEKFSQTQQQVTDISSSFKLVVKVLSQEVLFSQLLKQIAATIPNNANLTSLTINQADAAIDISANATDYNTASQVQVNLADPANKIFSKADIESITCAGADASDPQHPCTITIRALFVSNNPFLLINSKAAD